MNSPVMVDWVTGSFVSPEVLDRVSPPFETGKILKINPEGEITQEFSGRSPAVGSFDSSMSFRAPYGHQLEMSGNPAKFLQGHNLFGSDEPVNLFFAAGWLTMNDSLLFPAPPRFDGMFITDDGKPFPKHTVSELRFTRIDLTRSYKFPTNELARQWLRLVGASGHSRHRNNLTTNGTIYYGKTSTRWSMKIYQKFDEITSGKKGHGLSEKFSEIEKKELTEWAEGVVRFEITLRRPEIEKLNKPFNSLDIWSEYYSKVAFNKNEGVLNMEQLEKLPMRLQTVLISWQTGADIRNMTSRTGFYRVRSDILKAVGIDIAVAPIEKEKIDNFELQEKNWDPEPIKELLVLPGDEVVEDYLGVKPSRLP